MKKFVFFLLGLAVLAVMVWQSDPATLWQQLQLLRWHLLSLVAVWGVGYLLNATSWGFILSTFPMQQALSPLTLLRFTISGFAINYITPFGLLGGEPYRVLVLRPYVGLEAATSSVTLYAMMHMCSHFLFWTFCALFSFFWLPRLGVMSVALLVFILLASLLLVWLFFRGYRRGVIRSAVALVASLPFLGRRVGAWQQQHDARLRLIDDGISRLLLHHPLQFWLSLLFEFVSRLVNCTEIWLIFCLFGLGGSWFDAMLVVAFSSLFANLLFFSPLQMGTREGGILLSLRLLALPASLSVAVSVSFATRLREFCWIALGLLLTLCGRRRS